MRTLKNLKYHQGGTFHNEEIEVDIINKDENQNTSCTISVDLFLCEKWTYSCQNGSDITFTPAERLEILKFIQAEHKKITDNIPVKTYRAWRESGLSRFEDFCFFGDEVDKAMVDYFMNVTPPIKMLSQCMQARAPYGTEFDNNMGLYRNTYITFHRIGEEKWIFDGYCFYGENTNRHTQPPRIEELIAETEAKVF